MFISEIQILDLAVSQILGSTSFVVWHCNTNVQYRLKDEDPIQFAYCLTHP